MPKKLTILGVLTALAIGAFGVFSSSSPTSALPVQCFGANTLLNGAHTAGVTTITVDSTQCLPASGTAQVEAEKITYTGKTATTLTGATRGASGTTATAHPDNAHLRIPGNALDVDWTTCWESTEPGTTPGRDGVGHCCGVIANDCDTTTQPPEGCGKCHELARFRTQAKTTGSWSEPPTRVPVTVPSFPIRSVRLTLPCSV